ncbi:hypothetical protein GFY24_26435 [Nocardia sp. SYP-A9097]|uniref:hypothetical protein n=1 Tax=Nocardia sp. SYP-A9097 TaxID=2663237 RepID=UPI00129AF082|nr:hypothetical protein [Nocardia sp. SYP-A9097]MRH90935.1 hypothetical protein [Nocardia sp. SYP-A9097]
MNFAYRTGMAIAGLTIAVALTAGQASADIPLDGTRPASGSANTGSGPAVSSAILAALVATGSMSSGQTPNLP